MKNKKSIIVRPSKYAPYIFKQIDLLSRREDIKSQKVIVCPLPK